MLNYKEISCTTAYNKLKSTSWKREIINIGGVTDSYQKIEEKMTIRLIKFPKVMLDELIDPVKGTFYLTIGMVTGRVASVGMGGVIPKIAHFRLIPLLNIVPIILNNHHQLQVLKLHL